MKKPLSVVPFTIMLLLVDSELSKRETGWFAAATDGFEVFRSPG
ncbi:MAG: hypothetical protein ABW174_00865 [Flavitalea sp.]